MKLSSSLQLLALLASLFFFTQHSLAAESQQDSRLLKIADWQLVQNNCTSCHGSALIAQNSGNREVWKSRIRWMQDTQGLTELTAETEDRILTYLSSNYGPKTTSRRPVLSTYFLPINPYPSSD